MFRCLISIAVLFSLMAECNVGFTQEVEFNRDVRPLLAKHCFACHGPDAEHREADLRLDSFETATQDNGSGPAIVPGSANASSLFQRISSTDADLRMPPAPNHEALSEKEISIIREWITAGAEYKPHWAFVAPQRPPVPDFSEHPIDAFVLQRLKMEGLEPSPQADIQTLARRVSLDLIGLPPTPEELRQFLDEAEQMGLETAYGTYVDRLLASPHYGERWARKWLDLARYADTNGYEKDRERQIWAYRDWVIDALNSDMPFDEFTTRQLAGDLLESPTTADRIATGFHRNTMINEEGGIDPLEFRFYAMVDRVSTTGATWLGLTLQCVQCHTHKYDPIEHGEFYGLMALMNNVHEIDMTVPDAAMQQDYESRLHQATNLVKELPEHWPVESSESVDAATRQKLIDSAFAEWLSEQRTLNTQWTSLQPLKATSNLPLLTILDDNSILGSGDTTKLDNYSIELSIPEGEFTSLRLEALPDESLPANGPGMTYYEGTVGDFFLAEMDCLVDGSPLQLTKPLDSFNANRFGNNPATAAQSIDGDPQTGWSVHGRQGERHTAVYTFEKPLVGPRKLNIEMLFGRHFPSSLGRFRFSVASSVSSQPARDITEEFEILLLLPEEQLTVAQRNQLLEHFLLSSESLKEWAEKIRTLRKPPQLASTLVLTERPIDHVRPTFRHKRGEYLQPQEQVAPEVLHVLHDFPGDAPRNRLGLAMWLNSPENPLTARVVVNRQWEALFGRGLVETSADFGTQGSPPSHPELLDWLAVEFREQGWSLKTLHRLIVTSQTYRQSSSVSPASLAVDPENVLLARAPRPRLDAETLRDSILRAAGILSSKRGGPGVRPPQPVGVTEAAYGSPKWPASEGEDRNRRSIYTFIKRSAPFAMYSTFDAPSGETCTVQRERSDTPLQALTLLNDVVVIEAANAFGKELVNTDGTDSDRIRLAFERVLARPADEEEYNLMKHFIDQQRIHLTAADANDISVENQAWSALARALFSLDEAVTRN
ncbi:MAG: PSD1 and planctomycete cytochrome C domain-containing protein [Planctomycetaceae bacterium]